MKKIITDEKILFIILSIQILYPKYFILSITFFHNFCDIAHNVPAVCDVPARPIKQTAGLRAGWNVGEAGVGASRRRPT
ncbi:MAG: hypothetical protein LBH20_03670 [Treponema sp.]|jgi:hypothetical protein|nr:hypothetical protein [Treponema sp.]